MAASVRFGRSAVYFALRAVTQNKLHIHRGIITQNKLRCAAWGGSVVRELRQSPPVWALPPLQVQMPALSPTMEEGNIVKWLKKEGDAVAAGDALCEIETDKAVVVMESNEDGVLAKILVQEGSRAVRLGTLIALMVSEGEDWRQVQIPPLEAVAPPTAAPPTAAPPAAAPPAAAPPTAAPPTAHGHAPSATLQPLRLSPAARHILDTHGLDPHLAKASGPRGLITKEDALNLLNKGRSAAPQAPPTPAAHPQAPPTAPPVAPPTAKSVAPPTGRPSHPPVSVPGKPGAPGTFTEIPASELRRLVAQRVSQSKRSIPHCYTSVDCDISGVMRVQRQLQSENINVSVNDFIIKAAAVTLRDLPAVNVLWSGDGAQTLDSVHITVEENTAAGPVTHTIRDADHKSLSEIAQAQKGEAQTQESQRGSFSVSNLGVREFSAVITPPQVCVLAVGVSRARLSAVCEPDAQRLRAQQVLTVTLSSDGRLVDDTLASRFLEAFRCTLERPERMSL